MTKRFEQRNKRWNAMLLMLCLWTPALIAAPAGVKLKQSAAILSTFEFMELTLVVEKPDAMNPFTDVVVNAEMASPGGSVVKVDGFCDAADGSVFRVRFMPRVAGKHAFAVTYRQGAFTNTQRGSFTAMAGKLAGPVRVDPAYPFHFIREGTEQHWFWNATTTYQLLAWDDDTIARLAPFANVMWDVANEYRLFRDDPWAEKMGAFVKECDPYDHLTSVHGHGDFRFRKSPWADFAMYQSWDEHGSYAFMLKNRREQAETGRSMPQINEEYGYEDHYPFPWGEKRLWPARISDNRRRLAWEMSMAGCYQTTGERANDGTGAGPDTGGGWVNGRGNETMTMLIGYRHMMSFFTSFDWWKLDPRDDLAGENTLLLATPGQRYAAYLQNGGVAKFTLAAGTYRAKWFNPRTGAWSKPFAVKQATDGNWTSAPATDNGDWALLLYQP